MTPEHAGEISRAGPPGVRSHRHPFNQGHTIHTGGCGVGFEKSSLFQYAFVFRYGHID